ncbi:ras-related protein Rab-38-like [Corticium candelabrum]|uniref:ras-related protein Rab-38-like n=1 Tax=Corticium candelabrum TaxID=121492 RepID=UPI002E2697E3|nr:ras-related protein Rab-38-like [Corticium candelabrum]
MSMSTDEEAKEYLYKVLVIGEASVGKTSIIKRYVHRVFSAVYQATIGVDFAMKLLPWDDHTLINLQMWDIAGQERYGNMTRVYYREAVGAFIVFDVSRSATFDAVQKWKNDLDEKVHLPNGKPVPCILLANKCDKPKEGIVIDAKKMEEYCVEKGFLQWYETSAKDNINIDAATHSLVAKIIENEKYNNWHEEHDQYNKLVNLRESGMRQNNDCC